MSHAIQEKLVYKKKGITVLILFLFILFIFIVFPSIVFQGAKDGLLLWFHQLLPSLLPFLILTNLLLKLNLHHSIGKLLYPVLHPLFQCSSSGSFAIVVGLLSGLPVGTKVLSDLYLSQEITKKEAYSLLPFCSNPSPMFLVCYIAVSELNLSSTPFIFLLITVASSVVTHYILRLSFFLLQRNKVTKVKASSKYITHQNNETKDLSFQIFDGCIMNAFEVIVKVGGYVMLFSIIVTLLPYIFTSYCNSVLLLVPLSTLELTTGIHLLCSSTASASLIFPVIAFCCCFSGVSGIVQTKSVLSNQLMPFRLFFCIKFLQGCVGCVLSIIPAALGFI